MLARSFDSIMCSHFKCPRRGTWVRKGSSNGTNEIQIGDSVRFRLGPSLVDGTVKEDRGPIGMKGRRLYPSLLNWHPITPFKLSYPNRRWSWCGTLYR